jgi:hypothetical protein
MKETTQFLDLVHQVRCTFVERPLRLYFNHTHKIDVCDHKERAHDAYEKSRAEFKQQLADFETKEQRRTQTMDEPSRQQNDVHLGDAPHTSLLMVAAAKITKAIEESKLPKQLKHAIAHALQSWIDSPNGHETQDSEKSASEVQKSVMMIAHFNSMIAKYEQQVGVGKSASSAPVVEAAATGVEAERSNNAVRTKGEHATTLMAAAGTIMKAVEGSKLPKQLKHALSQALEMSMGEQQALSSSEGGEGGASEAQKSEKMIAHFNSMIAKYEQQVGVA